MRVNGLDLSGSEYDLLSALVDSDDPVSTADSIYEKDRAVYTELIRGLARKKLVESLMPRESSRLRSVTAAGRSAVTDYRAALAQAEADKRDAKRHDWLVASYGIVGGAVAGGLMTLLLHSAFGL